MRIKQEVYQVEGCARHYAWKTYHIRLHVLQHSHPDAEHGMFETCRIQEELN